jgi:hypothetical protein
MDLSAVCFPLTFFAPNSNECITCRTDGQGTQTAEFREVHLFALTKEKLHDIAVVRNNFVSLPISLERLAVSPNVRPGIL